MLSCAHLMTSCAFLPFRHFNQWFSTIFPPYSLHCSLIKVFHDHHRLFLGFSCCYGDTGTNTATVTPVGCAVHSGFFVNLSPLLCFPYPLQPVSSTHIFSSCLSVPLSLSLDLFGASMLQSCEKLALVQLVSSKCRESMLELFANVHSMAHTPA